MGLYTCRDTGGVVFKTKINSTMSALQELEPKTTAKACQKSYANQKGLSNVPRMNIFIIMIIGSNLSSLWHLRRNSDLESPARVAGHRERSLPISG